MEPFGLFQFLQSLLKNPPAQDTQEEVNTPETVADIPAEKPSAPNNDAYLQFIANHEKRSQGIRKK
ncbi:MAG: hypothetical protein E7371_01555 [Clostridiales bacterium]|nr:hypothetical protein [Clostridiales bacterium]